jgi:hypothetical protein
MIRSSFPACSPAGPVNDRRWIRWLVAAGWVVVAVVLLSGVVGGVGRGLEDRPNWGSLKHESAYVWEHRSSNPGTAMFGYLPTATFALWPFTAWAPQPWGLFAYLAVNLAAGVASIWIVRRWWYRPGEPDWSFVVPVLLGAGNIQHVIQANQLTLWALLLSVAGLTLVGRRRPWVGGMLLGLAGLIKVLPFVLAGLLILGRKWRALAGMAAAVVLFDLVPSVVFLGPHRAAAEHRAWLQRSGWHSSGRQIEQPLLIGVHRHRSSFSLAAVMARWLRGMPAADVMVALVGPCPAAVVAETRSNLQPNEVLLVAPMPPPDRPWSVERTPLSDVPRFCAARWSARTVWWIWAGVVVSGVVVLAWATCRAGRASRGEDWLAAGAVWLLIAFFVSPMMRHYYLALAFPAIVVVWRRLCAERQRLAGRFGAGTILAAAAMVAWGVGVAALGWDLGRWYGLHLAAAAILLAAAAWAWASVCRQDRADNG